MIYQVGTAYPDKYDTQQMLDWGSASNISFLSFLRLAELAKWTGAIVVGDQFTFFDKSGIISM